ncbi:MAG: spermidine synthase, partial [Deltaproteobacteria bacterium]
MSPTILRILIIACFFLSGMTGLVYQTAWARILGLVFGNTVHAVSTVLTVFFAGLAIGAYALGVLADRWGDRWGKGSLALLYGLLEIGIALWGFAVPWLFRVVETLYLHRLHPLDHSLLTLTIVRFLLAFLILIVPTTLMGGTLPVLVKFFVRSIGEVGRGFGMLYFVNTLGAALGVALCGFVLFQVTGVTGAIHLTAFFNFLIGLSACLVARLALPAV